MQNTEVRVITDIGPAPGHESALDLGRRQAWLRALENANLQAALVQTRVMEGGGRSVGEECTAPAEMAGKERALRDESGREATEVPPPLEGRRHALVSGSRDANAGRPAGDAWHPGSCTVDASGHVRNWTAPEGGSAHRPAVHYTAHRPDVRRQWPVRSVLVLPSQENGVEVWVRDASMSGARAQMLLADLRRTAGEQGAALARLTVNGKRLYSPDQHWAGTYAAKEE